MRIAIMGTRGVPNHYGGFEQLAEHLAPGLAAAGHEVTVYNPHDHPYRDDCWKGVRIIHCHDPGSLLGTAGQFVYDLNCMIDARTRDYDVILQLGYTSSSVWGPLFPARAVTIYNMDGLEWQRKKYSRLVRRFLLYAERLAIRFGRHHIADSPVIQSYLRDKYGIESEYIAYGADVFDTAEEEHLQTYGVQPGEYYLVMARMEPENNIGMMLEGFSASRSHRKLLVIGEMGNSFSRWCRTRFRHDPRIVFAGAVFDKERLHSLKHYCQLYFHGHSTGGTNPSLLEAMASGALIVAHDNPFNRQVLGEDALYFSGAAQITALIDNGYNVSREAMTSRNRSKIRDHYDWPAIIAHYERFIVQCAGSVMPALGRTAV